ncbi:hypothetical protein [Streptosporangium sp. NPDC001681]
MAESAGRQVRGTGPLIGIDLAQGDPLAPAVGPDDAAAGRQPKTK